MLNIILLLKGCFKFHELLLYFVYYKILPDKLQQINLQSTFKVNQVEEKIISKVRLLKKNTSIIHRIILLHFLLSSPTISLS